jgi:dihydrofolate reductase
MSHVRVHNFSVSLDGFATGEGQSLEAPFGHAGTRLHEWFFGTRTFQEMFGGKSGETGVDDAVARTWDAGIGAEIMGRNKFGPQRGPWEDESWKGWWGPNPPFHTPVFVLTHHPRPSIEMEGGTTFHFVSDGIESALTQAKDATRGRDVWLAGGGSVVNQYLAARLVDEVDVSIVPLILGAGARLFEGLDRGTLKLTQIRAVDAPGVTHVKYELS